MKPRALTRAVTLVELLTAIAIAAILLALLFPVFGRAKEQGHITACRSNLRQIGIAINLYRAEYDGLSRLGSVSQAGLPQPGQVWTFLEAYDLFELKCGATPKPWMPAEAFPYPYLPQDGNGSKGSPDWGPYANEVGEEAIVFIDYNHNPSDHPWMNVNYRIRALGLRLSGALDDRYQTGNVESYNFWK